MQTIALRANLRALAVLLFLVLSGWGSNAFALILSYHFRAPATSTPVSLGAQVLTPEERDFLAQLPEVRVGIAHPAFLPYEVIGQDGEISGMHPEMLAALGRAFGFRLRPVVFPNWNDLMEGARKREVDVLMSVGVTSARSEYLEFTLGATPMVSAMFGRKGSVVNPELARFALERGNMSIEHIQRRFPNATIMPAENTLEALNAVADGQADYYVGTLLPAMARMEQQPVSGIEVNQLISYGSGYFHFGVRNDWAILARILNKGITAVRYQPSRELTAALAALPATFVWQVPKRLTPQQQALLIERPVWRMGAVRGLTLLNDVDDKGRHSGIGADYAEAVARRLGVGLRIQAYADVAGMLDALRRGEIDMVPFLTRTDDRARDFSFSSAYFTMPYMLVARNDAPLYWDLNSLRGRRLALAAQHPLRELLAKRYGDIQIVDVKNGDAAMDAVAQGQADAAVEIKLFANLRINGDNDGHLRAVAAVDDLPAQFNFAASRQAQALMPLVNEVLADIPEPERLRMQRRWVAQDLTPAFPWKRHLAMLATGVAALLVLALATAWWVSRLRREIKARTLSEERLNDIGAALPCVAFRTTFDADGELQSAYYSPGAQAFLGMPLDPAKTLLQNIGARLPDVALKTAQAAQQASLKSGAPIKLTGRYLHPDGVERWLHTESVVKTMADGGSALTGYLVDVTAERDMQAQLVQAERMRHLLLASASHELRAPTHTLSLALQAMVQADLAAHPTGQVSGLHDAALGDGLRGGALRDGLPDGPDAPMRAHLRVAREAARTLTQLLNDVLDAARLDQGEIKLRPQAFALRALVEESNLGVRAWVADKGLQYRCEVGAEVPAVVMLDPLRLRQIITNLLSNAVKYTASGTVSLVLEMGAHGAEAPLGSSAEAPVGSSAAAPIGSSAEAPVGDSTAAPVAGSAAVPLGDSTAAPVRDSATPQLRITVADTGAGIAPQLLRRLFTPYEAGPAANAVPEGSTGLGLSVCRRLVELMGGAIEVHSAPGQGTRAEVRLPLPALREQVSDGQVLVCDDDDISRTLLVHMLMLQGYGAVEARDGNEALQRWRQGDVRAVITDLDMPGLPGLALIRAMRAEEAAADGAAAKGAGTRVLVCSGSHVPEAEIDGGTALHDAYLSKPIDMAVLVDTLAALGLRPTAQQAGQAAAPHKPPPTSQVSAHAPAHTSAH